MSLYNKKIDISCSIFTDLLGFLQFPHKKHEISLFFAFLFDSYDVGTVCFILHFKSKALIIIGIQ